MKLTPNFKLAEFISPRDPSPPDSKALANLKRLAEALEDLRALAGKPLHLTSGYRSPDYNRKIGGASASQHVQGIAADVVTADQIKLAALASQIPEIGAIGLYPGRAFIHVDLRPRVNGKLTTWQQVDGRYKPLSPEQVKALKAAGAQGL